MTTRTFPLDEVLSASTGRLVADRHMDALYDLFGHVLNDQGISTIGLACMADTVRQFLLQQFPELANVETESLDRGLEAAFLRQKDEVQKILAMSACRLWVDRMAERIGKTSFDVPQMPGTQPRTLMDDIDYVREVNPNAQIFPVVMDDNDHQDAEEN